LDCWTTDRIIFFNAVHARLPKGHEEFAKEATKVLAVKLYEMGKLTSGRAAEFAGMSRISFLQILAEFGTPIFDLTKDELERDLNNA
jgi:predicted HTH domain antitoxin